MAKRVLDPYWWKDYQAKQEILDLLAALWLPTKLAIIHCPGHQRADTTTAEGNQRTDQVAKEASEQTTVLALILLDPGLPNLPEDPAYTPANLCMIQHLSRAWWPQQSTKWWMTGTTRFILPGKLVETLLHHVHCSAHLGTQKTEDLIRHSHLKIFDLQHKIEQIAGKCLACQLTNADNQLKNPGNRLRGTKPGSHGK